MDRTLSATTHFPAVTFYSLYWLTRSVWFTLPPREPPAERIYDSGTYSLVSAGLVTAVRCLGHDCGYLVSGSDCEPGSPPFGQRENDADPYHRADYRNGDRAHLLGALARKADFATEWSVD
jgi:hypothetical protein